MKKIFSTLAKPACIIFCVVFLSYGTISTIHSLYYTRARHTIKDINNGKNATEAFYNNFGCDIDFEDYNYITRRISLEKFKEIQPEFEEYKKMCGWSIESNFKLQTARASAPRNDGFVTGVVLGQMMSNKK